MDLTGQKLGPFQIEGRLGQGAMGTVYRATHTENGKTVAIKVMTSVFDAQNPVLTARFEREIKILSQFRHPNIVRIFGASFEQGIRFYAMELIEGESLEDLLTRKGVLSQRRVVAYGKQMCEALQELHRVGVVHRDLKPANIMISSNHRVKLTDFGIAKDTTAIHGTQLTKADHTIGTIAYMSPEQLSGEELTRRADIYALGIVFYQLLTGRLPFQGETIFEYMTQRAEGKFPLPSAIEPSVSAEFDELIARMLAQDPESRPRDAYVVLQALMDIDQKSKDGTLARGRGTEANQKAAAAETIVETKGRFSTLIGSVTSLFVDNTSRSKKRRSRRPWYESTPFLAAVGLAALGIVAWFLLVPAGPNTLLQRGKTLLDGNTRAQWEQAINDCFIPIIQKHPTHPAAAESRELVKKTEDRIALHEANVVLNRAKIGLRSENPSEPEQQFLNAWQMESEVGDAVSAQDRYRAIVLLYRDRPDARGWVLLAEQRLDKSAEFANDEQRIAAKRRSVSATVDRIALLRKEGKTRDASQLYFSLEDLYRDDAEVKDLISRAQIEQLGQTVPELTPAVEPTPQPGSEE